MKKIVLTRGQVALVDDEDYALVSHHRWYANNVRGAWYACCMKDGRIIKMHQLIVGQLPKGYEPDHIDRDGLNNRRSNLRIVTRNQNNQNRVLPRKSKYGYIGVYYNSKNKFRASVSIDGKNCYLGSFATPEEAARARDLKAVEVWGECARLNFPDTE